MAEKRRTAAPRPQSAPSPAEADGRRRIVIEGVSPSVDGGRFAAKRVAGDTVRVEADCFTDGHDAIAARVLWRREQDSEWREAPMSFLVNDRWAGSFVVEEIGRYRYTVTAWVDQFKSWRHDLSRRVDPEDIAVAAKVGAQLIEQAAQRAGSGEDARRLADWARQLAGAGDADEAKRIGLDESLGELAQRHPDRSLALTYPVEFPLIVDRPKARYSTWYELFPRSASPEPERHGTLRDVEARLPYVAELGFDVLYLPPIHPIGRVRRKGKNNTLTPDPEDVGSPWAIGSPDGGHKSIEPRLGTIEDFRRLVARANELGIEIALDIAFQCAPDHPYVTEHPSWFRWRPDGTVQYAENPPKKYQDIYPFNFETDDWQALWDELASVFEYWIGHGVKIFRVDNPHTKPFPFWEWAIERLKRTHPDLIFLSEAFTRPKVMHRLAKLGYTQSYTYFAWRNTKWELTEYFTELAHGPGRDYFRPNVWPNTPDILTEYLQYGGRPAFIVRLILAATLSASYGIYGPAFELIENRPREPGSEEYLDSEKYQLRHWDLDRSDSLRGLIALVNRIRRENPALHSDRSLRFFQTDNDSLICYCKTTDDLENVIVAVVNVDPYHVHSGWVEIDLRALQLEDGATYQMHDLLTGARYLWTGSRNFVRLDPNGAPAHVFRLRRRVRREADFDYFM
ncbi:MAG TPA: alpha-1,4-glucan--maltose-1-phosphate maltosyltransferase [Burkholderiaceae bacterium]|nr:alpha-1,4-glucan--maltose-1-phosphate maltosyltransferase [Burkholderiaceae bacterium]